MKVLIVEDDLLAARYLKDIVESVGMKVCAETISASQALEAFRKYHPDIVLLDVMICGSQSGCELGSRLRALGWRGEIVFLSAYCDDEMIEAAAEVGARAYLLKPYRPDEIRATLRLCSRYSTRLPQVAKKSDFLHLVGGYGYDLRSKTLLHKDQTVWLRNKEKSLIDMLCAYPHKVFTHTELIEALWEKGSLHDLRTLVYRLRRATVKGLICSVRRSGYRIGLQIG